MNWEKYQLEGIPDFSVEVKKIGFEVKPEGFICQKVTAIRNREWDAYALSYIKILTELNTEADCEALIAFLQFHKRCLRTVRS